MSLLRRLGVFAVLLLAITLCGCTDNTTQTNKKPQTNSPQINTETTDEVASMVEMIVNGKTFDVFCYDNETVKAFVNALPLSLEMKELNGNEKYYYLNNSLPCAESSVGSVSCGDLMLYGTNCIVLFYKNFHTAYNYTKIGKVSNVHGLAQALGTGTATITFQIK